MSMTNMMSAEQEKAVIQTKEVLASKQDVLMAIGKLQAFSHIRKYVTVTEIITFKKIKESKQYKGLVYENDNGESVTVTDLKDVCEVFFGRSYESMTRDLNNLEAFGAEFLESSQSMGLGYRDLRKLRQLPSDDQTLVLESEAINSGDKEAVKELIDELNDKHNKEKSTLERNLTEQTQLAKARDSVIKTNYTEKQALEEKLALIQKQQKHNPAAWLKTVQEINLASCRLMGTISQALGQLLELNESITTELINEEHSEQALELMATVQLHNIDEVFMLANNLSYETRERFSAFTTLARPMHTEDEILAIEQQILERV